AVVCKNPRFRIARTLPVEERRAAVVLRSFGELIVREPGVPLPGRSAWIVLPEVEIVTEEDAQPVRIPRRAELVAPCVRITLPPRLGLGVVFSGGLECGTRSVLVA